MQLTTTAFFKGKKKGNHIRLVNIGVSYSTAFSLFYLNYICSSSRKRLSRAIRRIFKIFSFAILQKIGNRLVFAQSSTTPTESLVCRKASNLSSDIWSHEIKTCSIFNSGLLRQNGHFFLRSFMRKAVSVIQDSIIDCVALSFFIILSYVLASGLVSFKVFNISA